ncbi:MAG: GNAT family N-acetyltransferase [Methylobacterium sp.]|nr:GNAT family N-acetyltransferase [Methylobacterium sp.]MCA3650470.1 GNAT family N-acetyltransferase [Methylobacterium sp.]MCA4924233.1 GNAT family N-acetyltransferase [Methylobacterium sp.]
MFPDLFRDDVFTLETARLFLRWPKAKDVALLIAEAGDRRVAEPHAVIPHPYLPEDAIRFVSEARSQNMEGKGVYLAITPRKDQERLVGVASLRLRSTGEVSLGYWLGVQHWGKGYATEAAQAVLDAAFLYSDVKAIIAGVRVMNDRSRAVLERCGFQYAGSGMSERPAWGDRVSADHYRLSRGTWASLKGWRAPLPTESRNFARGPERD